MDSREASKNRDIELELYRRIPSFSVEKLDAGDYLILRDKPVLIERMTPTEILHQSKVDQIKGMVQDNPEFKAFLLFEGTIYSILQWRKIPENVVYGKFVSFMVDWGVHMIFSYNKTQTIEWISQFYRFSRTKDKRTIYTRPSPRRGVSFRDQQLWILSSIRGIGRSYAEKLLDHFGTVQAVFNSSVAEVVEVKGIGQAKARKIVSVVTNNQHL